MAKYPKIDKPCPYRSGLSAVMEGDMCRMCNRQVIDLNPLSDQERVAFLNDCKEEVCVSYRFPIRATAAALIAAAAVAAPMSAAAQDRDDMDVVVVGGITDPKQAQYVSDSDEDAAVAEAPVIYEDAAANARAATSEDGSTAAAADLGEPLPAQ